MFGNYSSFYALQDGEGEGYSPEYSASCLYSRNVDSWLVIVMSILVLGENILQHSYHKTNEEEEVGQDVVIVPECEVTLLEPAFVRFWPLESPQEESCPNIPEAVGRDEDGEEPVHPVDVGDGGLVHVAEDQRDEDAVGEGRVDCSVEGNPPLLAEPGGNGVAALAGEDAGVEEGVEEEKEVARDLLEDMKDP